MTREEINAQGVKFFFIPYEIEKKNSIFCLKVNFNQCMENYVIYLRLYRAVPPCPQTSDRQTKQ